MAIEIDLASLLAPHEGAGPAGVDLREDVSASSLYFRIRDSRSEARAAERAADTAARDDATKDTEAARHWREVSALSREALSRRTKDVEIAAWLTEALVRSDGIAGLAAGAALLDGLAGFWDGLYPMPDEDGIATRVAAITGLNGESGDGTLIQPLRKIVLFTMPDGSPLRYFEFKQSEEATTIADPKRLEARRAAGVRPFDSVEAAGRAAGPAALAALRDDLAKARAAWAAMAETYERLAGTEAPPTSRVGALLDEIGAVVERFLPAAPSAPAAAESRADDMAATGAVQPGPPRRSIETREDALALLSEVAMFFRRAEPQSPLAYTIDEAMRRARMTWPELLQEVITDDDTRRNVMLRLGIRPATE